MKRIVALAMAALLFGACSQGVLAQSPAPGPAHPPPSIPASPAQPMPGRQMNIWDYQKQLGLTNDQVTKVKAILLGEQKAMADNRTKDMKLSTDFNALLKSNADSPKLRAKLNEMAQVMIDSKMADIEADRGVRKILTKAQVEQWLTIVRTQRGQHPMMPPPPPASPAPSKH